MFVASGLLCSEKLEWEMALLSSAVHHLVKGLSADFNKAVCLYEYSFCPTDSNSV